MNTTENPPIVLRSDRLAVEIAQPGSVYSGTRFDWTGFITQVTLDGAHTFCVPESLTPGQGSGGVGLCNEFGIEEVIGYDEAQPGDPFPKLGIGLLARPDEQPYNFFRPYEIVAPFPIHVTANATQATFTVEPLECRGYAVRLTKTVTVEGAELTIAYTLENVGEKPIVTTEYVHNFLGIDGHAHRAGLPAADALHDRICRAAGAFRRAHGADDGASSTCRAATSAARRRRSTLLLPPAWFCRDRRGAVGASPRTKRRGHARVRRFRARPCRRVGYDARHQRGGLRADQRPAR